MLLFGGPDFYLTIYCTYILIEHLCSEVLIAYLCNTWVSSCDHDFGHAFSLGHPTVYGSQKSFIGLMDLPNITSIRSLISESFP